MVTQLNDSIALSPTQLQVQSAIRDRCAEFDEEYWREKDRESEYPHEFVKTLAENGWLGILVPEEYGGKGYGTEEAVVMMNEIAASGADSVVRRPFTQRSTIPPYLFGMQAKK